MSARDKKKPPPRLTPVAARVEDTALRMLLEQIANAGSVTKNLENLAPHRFAYSIDEAAARLGLSRSHVFNLLRRGEGPKIFRAGRRTLVSSSEMSAWISRLEALADAKSTRGGQGS